MHRVAAIMTVQVVTTRIVESILAATSKGEIAQAFEACRPFYSIFLSSSSSWEKNSSQYFNEIIDSPTPETRIVSKEDTRTRSSLHSFLVARAVCCVLKPKLKYLSRRAEPRTQCTSQFEAQSEAWLDTVEESFVLSRG